MYNISLEEVLLEAKTFIEKYLDSQKNLKETGREILDKELEQYRNKKTLHHINGKNGLFYMMIRSLTNRQGFTNFIGKDTLSNSSTILCNYNPNKVYETYKGNSKNLLSQYKKVFPDKIIRSDKKSAWPQYADGIMSIASFLLSFNSVKDFDKFVKSFSYNDYTKASLPLLLSKEIKGYGFALSCDFLKEVGYLDYGKPDIHLKDIFTGIHLISSPDDLEVFRMIIKISDATKEKPAVIDKVFWIIGSGRFNKYNDTHKNKIEIKRLKDEFIKSFNKLHDQ